MQFKVMKILTASNNGYIYGVALTVPVHRGLNCVKLIR